MVFFFFFFFESSAEVYSILALMHFVKILVKVSIHSPFHSMFVLLPVVHIAYTTVVYNSYMVIMVCGHALKSFFNRAVLESQRKSFT
jgi:hypothetical protein